MRLLRRQQGQPSLLKEQSCRRLLALAKLRCQQPLQQQDHSHLHMAHLLHLLLLLLRC
jgi:hypothetical protein